MTIYAGMDVSDKTTHLCLVDGEGVVIRRDLVASDPDMLAKWLKRHCGGLVRVVLETRAALDLPLPWPDRARCAGDLHLRAPRQEGAVGADQQARRERRQESGPARANRLVQGGAHQPRNLPDTAQIIRLMEVPSLVLQVQ
jgi:hypothetical protein